jgi:dipeptidase D
MNKILQFPIKLLIMSILISHQISLSTPKNLILQDLQPAIVWNYFDEISKIPRASGNEIGIANFILNEAHLLKLEAFKDNVGNVIVKKPASSELYKNSPIVVIQSHIDMVCEKNKNINHDFSKDPIQFVRKDNLLFANGTTLGADNGIGVAASLAIMKSDNLIHGPLEFIFTVMEESGFDGANNISENSVKGRILVNLDAEEEGSIYIGCAGSHDVVGILYLTREKVEKKSKFFSISIEGLRGGHSGVDIDKNRVNALKLAAYVLRKLCTINYRLVSINGGNKRNAIPRDIEFVLSIANEDEQLFHETFDNIKNDMLNEFGKIEKKLSIDKKSIDEDQEVFSKEVQSKIIELLETIPHGVIKVSQTLDNIVETSTNLARISTKEDSVMFETMQRSLVKTELKKIVEQVANVFSNLNLQVIIGAGSPEWQPNENSNVLNFAKKTFSKVFNKNPEIKAIHAGLECGAFVNQIPGLDTISFGPTINDAHSPNEHIDVNTVNPFWTFLTQLLEDMAKNNNI